MANLSVFSIAGSEIGPHIETLAKLRISVFREWPYLYDGDLDYERCYLADFARQPDSVLVLACDGDRPVGASTALPMTQAHEEFQAPFQARGDNLSRVFYLGESVLEAPYRGRGIGHLFFDEREAHAQRVGSFETLTFCAVERPDGHPLKPADYRPLDGFWHKRGYTRHPDLTCTFPWKDIDQDGETDKMLVFWTRRGEDG